MAGVTEFVTRVTGLQPGSGLDPSEAVALGAAVHAGVLAGLTSGVEMMDGAYVESAHGRATGF